jgi:hypothetical protein
MSSKSSQRGSWPAAGGPDRPSPGPSVPTLKQEVSRSQRRRALQGELDDEVGDAVAVAVAFDEPVATLLEGAKLSGRAAERAGADPGERLVARISPSGAPVGAYFL